MFSGLFASQSNPVMLRPLCNAKPSWRDKYFLVAMCDVSWSLVFLTQPRCAPPRRRSSNPLSRFAKSGNRNPNCYVGRTRKGAGVIRCTVTWPVADVSTDCDVTAVKKAHFSLPHRLLLCAPHNPALIVTLRNASADSRSQGYDQGPNFQSKLSSIIQVLHH